MLVHVQCRVSQGSLPLLAHLLQQVLVVLLQALQAVSLLSHLLLGIYQLLLVGLCLQPASSHLLHLQWTM